MEGFEGVGTGFLGSDPLPITFVKSGFGGGGIMRTVVPNRPGILGYDTGVPGDGDSFTGDNSLILDFCRSIPPFDLRDAIVTVPPGLVSSISSPDSKLSNDVTEPVESLPGC